MRPSGSCQMLGGTTATFVPCRLDSAAPLRTPASGLRMLARLADCRIAADIETIGIVAALAARARWLAAGAFSCSRSSLSGRPAAAFASTEGERRRRRAHNRSNATSTKTETATVDR
jgi:hypothetical protein